MSYNGVLNAFYTEIALLGMIFTGWVLRFAGVFKLPALVALNKFVFYICLLSTVFKAIANTGLSSLDWNFTACFFIIRAIAAVFWFVWTLVTKGSIGDFVIHWMSTTWINTIIFGVPILASIFSPAETAPLTPQVFALRYAVLASISSFFFQLPLQLILLELHRRRASQAAIDSHHPLEDVAETKDEAKKKMIKSMKESIAISSGIEAFFLKIRLQMSYCWIWYLHSKTTRDSSPRAIVLSILLRIFTNGPILGILFGFIWAAFQPRIPVTIEVSAKPIDEYVTNFANAVTPAAAIATGIFLFENPFKRVWKRIIIYNIFKFIVLPAAMIPLLIAFNIRGAAAQAAIVLTAMPIAISAFSLAKQYEVGTDETSTAITTGTLLMAPATLAWLAIIKSGLTFTSPTSPISPPSVPPSLFNSSAPVVISAPPA